MSFCDILSVNFHRRIAFDPVNLIFTLHNNNNNNNIRTISRRHNTVTDSLVSYKPIRCGACSNKNIKYSLHFLITIHQILFQSVLTMQEDELW